MKKIYVLFFGQLLAECPPGWTRRADTKYCYQVKSLLLLFSLSLNQTLVLRKQWRKLEYRSIILCEVWRRFSLVWEQSRDGMGIQQYSWMEHWFKLGLRICCRIYCKLSSHKIFVKLCNNKSKSLQSAWRYYWIGMNDLKAAGQLEWANTHDDERTTKFKNFGSNDMDPSRRCTMALFSNNLPQDYGHEGKWYKEKCDKTKGLKYVCKMDEEWFVKECPAGWYAVDWGYNERMCLGFR